jgi:hypothetical protein
MEQVLIFATILVPIVTALVELVKRTVKMPRNFVPLLAFVLGFVVAALAYPFTDLAIDLRLWAGAFAGLAATGLFELTMNPRKGTTGRG